MKSSNVSSSEPVTIGSFHCFLTLLLTGMRPGELCHLLLPDDIDLETGWLYVRNKPKLGWQVKTRNQHIPLIPAWRRPSACFCWKNDRPSVPTTSFQSRL